MMLQIYPLLLAVALVLSAVATPMLLQAAAPMLMRVPRAAVGLMIGTLAVWLMTAGGLSLTLAWLFAGPIILPGPIAAVCQRCLDAVRPYSLIAPLESGIPTALLLGLPAFGVVVLAAIGLYRGIRRYVVTNRLGRRISSDAHTTRVYGHDLLVIEDAGPVVFSLPRRVGGIVVSQGLLDVLDDEELHAVISHECAHLRQHHHLVLSALEGVVRPLRWLPIAAAIADAVPVYLEIAADASARHRTSTPALASALLKLGDTRVAAPGAGRLSPMLHAAGTERIRFLCAPSDTRGARVPIAALVAQVAAFAIAASVTHGPYVLVVLGGCQQFAS